MARVTSRIRLSRCAALCVVASLVALAPGPLVRPAHAVTLRGVVRAVAGGGPIAGAAIDAHARFSNPLPTRAVSAVDGSYAIWLPQRLDGVPAIYDVTFAAFGHETVTLTFTVLDESTVRQSVRLTPRPRFVVSGVVKNAADGTPLAGATVVLKGTPLPAQQTDETGAFAFPSVPAGRYEVEAASFCRRARSKTVVVRDESATTELRLRPAADAFGHRCAQVPFAWIEGVTPAPFTIPASPVVLPFPVFFYGTSFTTLRLDSRGVASFPREPVGGPPVPGPVGLLYPFRDDVASGRWRVTTVGVPPDRTFVAEFENRRSYPDSSTVDFEILLHERDGSIVFQYRGGGGLADGRSATIGIANATETDAFVLSDESSAVHDGLAVRLTPPSDDADGDGVANAIDVCPGVPDPDQLDRDGDGFGNACDDADGALLPMQLRIVPSTSTRRDNGRVVIEGRLAVHGAGDSTATPDGLTLRLTDALRLDETIEWTGDECKPRREGGVHCRRKRSPRHVAKIDALPSDGAGVPLFAVKVTLVELALSAPFVAPLRIELTNDPRTPGRGIDRIGTATDCAVTEQLGLECTGGREGSASRAFLTAPPASLLD